MKKLFIVFIAIGVLVAWMNVSAWACEGNCQEVLSFSGNHFQTSSAFIDKAKIKKGNVVDGGQSGAVQETKGSYKAQGPGIGGTGGIGTTMVYSENTRNGAVSAGLAANVGASGVIGRRTCAKLSGSGSVQTVAVKGGAAATSNGSFKYKGQTGRGLVVGAGATGGFSKAATGKNYAKSSAGHFTVSGITSIR